MVVSLEDQQDRPTTKRFLAPHDAQRELQWCAMLEVACSGQKQVIFCRWTPDGCRAWLIKWDDEVWNLLWEIMHDLKITKMGRELPWHHWPNCSIKEVQTAYEYLFILPGNFLKVEYNRSQIKMFIFEK